MSNCFCYEHPVKGFFTLNESERESEKDQRISKRSKKNMTETSKEIFAFAFAWYEWALQLLYYGHFHALLQPRFLTNNASKAKVNDI